MKRPIAVFCLVLFLLVPHFRRSGAKTHVECISEHHTHMESGLVVLNIDRWSHIDSNLFLIGLAWNVVDFLGLVLAETFFNLKLLSLRRYMADFVRGHKLC